MRTCTVFTQHIWAGEYTVTQRTKLEADAVRRKVVKTVDESSERIQCRSHVHSQDLVLGLCILYHELQDTNTLAEKKSMAVKKKSMRQPYLIKEAGELFCPLKFASAVNVIDNTNCDNEQPTHGTRVIQYLLLEVFHEFWVQPNA
jgi:uncharacterized protein YqfB (UPF0267 family)